MGLPPTAAQARSPFTALPDRKAGLTHAGDAAQSRIFETDQVRQHLRDES